MARPLRIELAGGVYHVTSRGDRQEAIYEDKQDRREWIALLGRVCKRFKWRVHSYCLMDNHYHLVLVTVEGNLSRGMRQLNGVYTQYFNRRHNRVGHVYQGRYTAIMVQKDAYLLELSRYVVLNPVRAKMVNDINDWEWSSYPAFCGSTTKPRWLTVNWILGKFSRNRSTAIRLFQDFVREGIGLPSIWKDVKKQVYLGSDQFVDSMLGKLAKNKQVVSDIPQFQTRTKPGSLDEYEQSCTDRNQAIRSAFSSGGYTMKVIGEHFGLHCTSISRIVNSKK